MLFLDSLKAKILPEIEIWLIAQLQPTTTLLKNKQTGNELKEVKKWLNEQADVMTELHFTCSFSSPAHVH